MEIRREILAPSDVGFQSPVCFGTQPVVPFRLNVIGPRITPLSVVVCPQPDATVALTLPILSATASSQDFEAIAGLVDAAIECVKAARPRYLKCLLPFGSPNELTEILAAAQFRMAVNILHLASTTDRICSLREDRMKSDRASSRIDFTLSKLKHPAAPTQCEVPEPVDAGAPPQESGGSTMLLLQEILDHATESADVPASSAEEMLRLWTSLDAEITMILATSSGISCGIAVSSRTKPGAGSPRRELTLEYIGVLSEYRRNGIGSEMIKRLIAHAHEQTTIASQPTMCRVHVDQQNRVARELYCRLGFSESGHSEVWIHDAF